MYHFEDTTTTARTDSATSHQLLLDGTVHLDYADDDLPSQPGLLAWIKQRLGLETA